jgi:DMSO/TMAO reductase YedYZ heme-binding membrane subunit
MTSSQKNWRTLAVAVLVSGIASATYLAWAGSSDENLRFLLRITARSAFLIFFFAFIARPLNQVYPSAISRSLLRHRRQTGIAFAGVHTVHLAVICIRVMLVPEFQFAAKNFVGAITYLFILLMLITSFDGPARAIDHKAWKILHKTGIYVIGASFAQTLLPESSQQLHQPEYILFSALIVAAILLRIAAGFWQRRRK